jgi:signal transduction histidine kinase
MMQGTLAAVELEISIALSGGDWLNVGTRFERPPWQVSSASLLSLLLSAGFGAVAVFWYVIARLTRPLVALPNATDALGRGEQLEPLDPAGPPEVKALATSFNTMQDRLKRFISDRTMMLAALAHDLRSPLTAMRVQSEMVEDEETRKSVSRSLDEMSDMVEATLSYARGVGTDEAVQSVLLADLFKRAGADVNLQTCGMTISVRPTSMTRALRNVIENAHRYGGGASVKWLAKDENLEIFVDDSGPGIPEEKIRDVFEPYVRLEQSRSRGTGGTGLGLSIARSVILAHGGQLELQNRPEGGLRAWIILPNVIRSKTVPELDFDTK